MKVYNNKFNYRKKFKPNIKGKKNTHNVKRRKLYTDNWNTIRKRVYQRDGLKCVLCGKKGKLHAHHVVPLMVSKDNSLSNLVSVCSKCHRKLEEVGFKILKEGGHRSDVKRVELRMIAEAKAKRRKEYQNKLKEDSKK